MGERDSRSAFQPEGERDRIGRQIAAGSMAAWASYTAQEAPELSARDVLAERTVSLLIDSAAPGSRAVPQGAAPGKGEELCRVLLETARAVRTLPAEES